jgi:hypothetical protein
VYAALVAPTTDAAWRTRGGVTRAAGQRGAPRDAFGGQAPAAREARGSAGATGAAGSGGHRHGRAGTAARGTERRASAAGAAGGRGAAGAPRGGAAGWAGCPPTGPACGAGPARRRVPVRVGFGGRAARRPRGVYSGYHDP